jgi:hypothetical protein
MKAEITTLTPTEQAKALVACAKRLGFEYSVRGGILTITKKFPAGSLEGFRDCDMMYGSVFEHLPRTSSGSDWGTDGGSGIGGMTALAHGVFRMNRSGGSKRVLAALEKL